jgi:hypothetical protein
MAPVTRLRDQARALRDLALDFSDPEFCGQLMDLAQKCEALADSIAKKSMQRLAQPS